MSSLTDRYVHAVTDRLPADQRDDIARELHGTIEDTVASSGGDRHEAERRALLDLGHPSRLADGYQGEERYLIGPRFYGPWLRTLKALLAVVPVIVAVVVVVLAMLDGGTVVDVIGAVVSATLWSALHVAFWVTLGFVVAERTGSDADLLEVLDADADWDPESLPEPQARQVSWGDAIASVVLNAFLLVLLVLPIRLEGRVEGADGGGVEWGPIFTDTAYSLRWVLAAGMALSLLASVVVLARGRWTWPAAVVNLVGMLLFAGPVVWLAARDDLFAWDNLPLQRITGGELSVNQPLALWGTVALLTAIVLWEAVDSFRKAAGGRPGRPLTARRR